MATRDWPVAAGGTACGRLIGTDLVAAALARVRCRYDAESPGGTGTTTSAAEDRNCPVRDRDRRTGRRVRQELEDSTCRVHDGPVDCLCECGEPVARPRYDAPRAGVNPECARRFRGS